MPGINSIQKFVAQGLKPWSRRVSHSELVWGASSVCQLQGDGLMCDEVSRGASAGRKGDGRRPQSPQSPQSPQTRPRAHANDWGSQLLTSRQGGLGLWGSRLEGFPTPWCRIFWRKLSTASSTAVLETWAP